MNKKNIHKSFPIIRRLGLLLTMIISGALFMVCYPFNKKTPEKENCQAYSSNDSIVMDIVDVLREGKRLAQPRRIEIEKKINAFPGKIIRRDTASFYLQTVLGIAFNEFVTEDFKTVDKISLNFTKNVQEANPLFIPIKYGIIKFSSFRIKSKQERNNTDDIFIMNPSPEELHNDDVKRYIADLLPDIPLDLNLQSYQLLFSTFKEAGGFPELITSNLNKDFFDLCTNAQRDDILTLISELWEIEGDVAETIRKNREREIDYTVLTPPPGYYTNDSIDFKEETSRKFKELSLMIYDREGNIEMVDSLIAINQIDSIGKYINNFQYMSALRGLNREIIEVSSKYEPLIPQEWKPVFYGYWGIAYTSLGEYEDALRVFAKSFENKKHIEEFSGSVLNYATTLALSGNIDEAIKLFRTQEDKACTVKQKFDYWDGLGYIYSFLEPQRALKCYDKADSILYSSESTEFNVNSFLSWPSNNCVRHFCRKAKAEENNLYKWRQTLYQAREASGIDAYVSFYSDIAKGLYHAESGRFKNLIFDFDGAQEDFEKSEKHFINLDSADYRRKWLDECRNYLYKFNTTYGANEKIILETLVSEHFSPIHNIWLIGNLAHLMKEGKVSDNVDIGLINSLINKNIVKSLFSLPNNESRHLMHAIRRIQQILFSEENIEHQTKNLSNLNLIRKGLLQTSKTALEKKLIEISGNLNKEYIELNKLRKELNHAYAYEDSLKIRKLLIEIPNKESDLYNAIKDSIATNELFGADIDEISNRLSNQDIAIDFIELENDNRLNYGAFLITSNSEPVYIDLTPYLFIQDSPTPDFSNLWIPILPYLQEKREIYFSPDGSLNEKGIEFYPDANGEPLFQNYRLHRLSHLRDIAHPTKKIEGEIALIGVSDHNSPIGEAEPLYRGDWTDLPDVEYEIKLIDSILHDYPHQLFYNEDAIEENIKILDGTDLSVLHFSTHGVYRDPDTLAFSAMDPNHFDHCISLRTLKTDKKDICGIVLRKGNLTWRMPHLLDDEDDILTAEEIEVMNFPNLQLTVLSACDSGLGEINSDGIQGLQRAFRIAGSKNIICSLNKVNDYWSAQFMGELYKNIAEGLSIYDSFRNAQLSVGIAAPENPVAWSSYILIE